MITIGVDESGTGAWAGPFTVCALAGFIRDAQYLTDLGVTDSKKLSDRRRRALCAEIVGYSMAGHIAEVSVREYNKLGHAPAWRLGMKRALTAVVDTLISDGIDPRFVLVIDGNKDPQLAHWIRKLQKDTGSVIWTRFVPKADAKFPFVSGASILAKTRRNDLMTELHSIHPEYGWKQNAGYGGSQHHRKALERYGKTRYHRNLKPLKGIPWVD